MSADEYKKQLIDIIQKQIPDSKIYLFGSRARGDHSETSDIDLAVYTKELISIPTMATIQEDINRANIPFFVDVVDANHTSKVLKMIIEEEKIPWQA